MNETLFWEGVVGGAFDLPQNPLWFLLQNGNSGLWILDRQFCHGQIQFPSPLVSSSFSLPLEVVVHLISFPFPFKLFLHFDQMVDPINHPTNLGSVRQGKGLMESFEPEAPNGLLLNVGSSDHTPDPFDGNHFLHIGPLSFPLPFHAFYQQPLQEPSID